MLVECDLEAPTLDIWKAVMKIGIAGIDPRRQLWRRETSVARLGREEKHVLPSRNDASAHHIRKYFRQPRAASEDEAGRAQCLATLGHLGRLGCRRCAVCARAIA